MRHDPKRLIVLSTSAILIVAILVFVFFKTRDIIFGARLNVFNVTDGQVLTDPYLEIKGQIRNAASIELNGHSVIPNHEGVFSEGIILSPGYNVITIHTVDKFGNRIERKYTLVYNDEASESTLE